MQLWIQIYSKSNNNKYVHSLRLHCNFIDQLCVLNDAGERGKVFLEIYPTKLDFKMEHNWSHVTFLDLDFSKDKGKFLYKMFDKRHTFNFHIARMLPVIIKLGSTVFYSSTMSEFVRTTRSTPVAKCLLDWIIN